MFASLALMLVFAGDPPPQVNLPGWVDPTKPIVVKTKAAKAEPRYVTRQITTYRAAVGHSHTHCVSWDHLSNASHNCPVCGALVLIQDRPTRPIPVTKMVKVQVE